MAAAYSPSYARVRVAKKAQMLEDRGVNTMDAIEEVAEQVFRDLNKDIIRQKRKIDADTAKFCKFVKWAIGVPASEVEATAKKLEDFLNGYGADKDKDKDKDKDGSDDSTRYRDFAEAQLKLALLDAYGNLQNRMPAELIEIRDHLAQRVDEAKFSAMCFSEKWEATRNAAVEAAHKAIVGGLHLCHATDEEIERTGDFLKRLNLERLILLHCTGEAAGAGLMEMLSRPVVWGSAGSILILSKVK